MKDEKTSFLGFEYRPGYGDMRGANHLARLVKSESGWVIVCNDREDFAEPETVTTYAVLTDKLAPFEELLEDVIPLAKRKKSDMFATDYTPWNFCIELETQKGRVFYNIEEYRRYSEADYALLDRVRREFEALRGDKISESRETQ